MEEPSLVQGDFWRLGLGGSFLWKPRPPRLEGMLLAISNLLLIISKVPPAFPGK